MGLVRAAQGARGAASAYVLLGTLPHSGRTRGVIAPATDQAHLVEAMDGVLRRLGGTARRWRVDRMATVIVPGTRRCAGQLRPGGQVLRGGRSRRARPGGGTARDRWRRRCVSPPAGGGGPWPLTRPRRPRSAWTGSGRRRAMPGCAARPESRTRPPMGAGRAGRRWASWPTPNRCWRCRPLPFPATIEVQRRVDHQASVAFRGNRYSVPPGLAGVTMTLAPPAGHATLDVVSPAGIGAGHPPLGRGRVGD